MAEPSKIVRPGQMQVPMQPQVIPFGGTLQVQLKTPEGRVLMVLVQVADWDLEKDVFLLNVGQVDVTQAAREGKIMGPPKGLHP